MSEFKYAVAAAAAVLLMSPGAHAAPFEFDGLYAGAHVGAVDVESQVNDATNSDEAAFGGLQIGYNVVNPSGMMYGVEADVSLHGAEPNGICEDATDDADGTCEFDFGPQASARLRAGFASGDFLVYATGGLAAGHYQFKTRDGDGFVIDDARTFGKFGWTAGGGVEYLLGDMISVKLEYRYTEFFEADYDSFVNGENEIELNQHAIMTGINWHF